MPFKSKAQARACYAKKDKKWDCSEWSEHTDYKKLPEKKAGSELGRAESKVDNILGNTSNILGNKDQKDKKTGPWTMDASSNVVADDAQIRGMEYNRHNHPLNYWLNPFIRGPLWELGTRLHRRWNATEGNSMLMSILNRAPYVGPGSSVASTFLGGPEYKTKARDKAHAPEVMKYDERAKDKQVSKERQEKSDKEKMKKASAFGYIIGLLTKKAAMPQGIGLADVWKASKPGTLNNATPKADLTPPLDLKSPGGGMGAVRPTGIGRPGGINRPPDAASNSWGLKGKPAPSLNLRSPTGIGGTAMDPDHAEMIKMIQEARADPNNIQRQMDVPANVTGNKQAIPGLARTGSTSVTVPKPKPVFLPAGNNPTSMMTYGAGTGASANLGYQKYKGMLPKFLSKTLP